MTIREAGVSQSGGVVVRVMDISSNGAHAAAVPPLATPTLSPHLRTPPHRLSTASPPPPLHLRTSTALPPRHLHTASAPPPHRLPATLRATLRTTVTALPTASAPPSAPPPHRHRTALRAALRRHLPERRAGGPQHGARAARRRLHHVRQIATPAAPATTRYTTASQVHHAVGQVLTPTSKLTPNL